MSYKIQTSDIEILRDAGVSEDDIKHCTKVAEKALEIAGRTGAKVDMEIVGRGALFHDLGKSKTHEIEHGRVGAELAIGYSLPPQVIDIMEKHIRQFGTHSIYYLFSFFGLPLGFDLKILSSFRSIFSMKLSLPIGRPFLV